MRAALRDRRWGVGRLGRDRDPHLAKGAMQPRLDRADRDAQGRRDLGQRHPQEVVQDDDRSRPLVEVAEHLVDLVPIGERAGHVGRWPARGSA